MNPDYTARIASLRALMDKSGVQAVIIPQADPHLSEYLAPHWQLRRWLTGFTGSAGDLVVTQTAAALWTDSRYFLQAARQLPAEVKLMKDGLASTPSITRWLIDNLKSGDKVGLDGMLFPWPSLAQMQGALDAHGITVVTDFNPAAVWTDRPGLPADKIYEHTLGFAGEDAISKIEKVLDAADAAGAGSTFISALDEIAWILNIRCNDVRHTPVATSFLYLGRNDKGDMEGYLFIDPDKTDASMLEYLANNGIATRPYDSVVSNFLHGLPADARVLVDPAKTSATIMTVLGSRAVCTKLSPAAALKSVKNDVQLDGVRNAMVRDGVAMVRSLMEIEERINGATPLTEMDIAEILRKYRSQGQYYRDESFGTIAGYGPHGAIVHYEATEATNATLRPEGLLLIDSGAQYLDGTTDITRTIALGTPTDQERHDFTLVMKGHIALATMMFPDDTRGAQLDAIARQYLWRNGLSYLHGTGHGVGHFLGVHEGPQSIRLNYVDAVLKPGMITSNEPGLYRSDVHGIRCENLVLCRRALSNEFGNFLRFETLTLCPFDRSLFDLSLMTPQEIAWVDAYHARVFDMLSPHLELDETEWLSLHTLPLEDND